MYDIEITIAGEPSSGKTILVGWLSNELARYKKLFKEIRVSDGGLANEVRVENYNANQPRLIMMLQDKTIHIKTKQTKSKGEI